MQSTLPSPSPQTLTSIPAPSQQLNDLAVRTATAFVEQMKPNQQIVEEHRMNEDGQPCTTIEQSEAVKIQDSVQRGPVAKSRGTNGAARRRGRRSQAARQGDKEGSSHGGSLGARGTAYPADEDVRDIGPGPVDSPTPQSAEDGTVKEGRPKRCAKNPLEHWNTYYDADEIAKQDLQEAKRRKAEAKASGKGKGKWKGYVVP